MDQSALAEIYIISGFIWGIIEWSLYGVGYFSFSETIWFVRFFSQFLFGNFLQHFLAFHLIFDVDINLCS